MDTKPQTSGGSQPRFGLKPESLRHLAAPSACASALSPRHDGPANGRSDHRPPHNRPVHDRGAPALAGPEHGRVVDGDERDEHPQAVTGERAPEHRPPDGGVPAHAVAQPEQQGGCEEEAGEQREARVRHARARG